MLTRCDSVRLHRRERVAVCHSSTDSHTIRMQQSTFGERCGASSLHETCFAYFDGASRSLRRFDWLHRRRDGVWVLTVDRYPHTICTGSCGVGTYMGLARPEKGTGHVQTFSPSELENLGVPLSTFTSVEQSRAVIAID